VIAVEKIIVARLKARSFKHTVELLAYPDAGHACFGPPVPIDSERYGSLGDIGGTPAGNNAARAESWAKLLAFLDAALN